MIIEILLEYNKEMYLSNHSHIHFVAWNKIYIPKTEGGLGTR